MSVGEGGKKEEGVEEGKSEVLHFLGVWLEDPGGLMGKNV